MNLETNQEYDETSPRAAQITPARRMQIALTSNPIGESEASMRARAQDIAQQFLDMRVRAASGVNPNATDLEMRAEAFNYSRLLTGSEDPLLRMWTPDRKGYGPGQGREALERMRGFVLDGEERRFTPRYRAYWAKDQAGRRAEALENRKTLDTFKRAVGDAATEVFRDRPDDQVQASIQNPLSAVEMDMELPDEVRKANETLRNPFGHWIGGAPDGALVGASDVVRRFRAGDAYRAAERERYEAQVQRDYEAELSRENAWNEVSLTLGALAKKGETDAYDCVKAVMENPDNRLPETHVAKFMNLSDEMKRAVVRTRTMLRPHVEGGFVNTVEDAAIGAANVALGVAMGPARQANKVRMASAGLDVNEIAKRRQYLYQATGDFGAKGAPEDIPQMQFEQVCEDHGLVAEAVIGAVSTLPYMGAAAIPYAGPALVAMEAMNEMDDHVAMNGGDITDPDYIVSSAVFGGLYAYTERLQMEGLLGDISDKELRLSLLKGLWSGIKNGKAVRHAAVGTVSESVQEGIQNGIMEVNNALALKQDAVRAFAEGFTQDFVGSLGTMLVVEGGGIVAGHAKRSGFNNPLTSAGREAGRAARGADLEETVNQFSALQEMVRAEDRGDVYKVGSEINRLAKIWKAGGADALVKDGGLTEERANEVSAYLSELRAAGETSAAAESAVPDDMSDETASRFTPLAENYVNGTSDKAPTEDELSGFGFSKDGARAWLRWANHERNVRSQASAIASALGLSYEETHGTAGAQAGDLAAVRRSMEELDFLRRIWADGSKGVRMTSKDGKTISDPGAKALEFQGFTKEAADRLSLLFHRERAAAYSKVALDGVRALYDAKTKGKVDARAAMAARFGGRFQRIRTGVDADGKPTYSDFITFTAKDGSTSLVEFTESPTGAPDFSKYDASVAESIEDATKSSEKPVTMKDWEKATPEERERIWKEHRLYAEGDFIPNAHPVELSVPGDPHARVSSAQAAHIIGRITVASESSGAEVVNGLKTGYQSVIDNSVAFHESFHAFSHFASSSGIWTEEDVKRLREKYGDPGEGVRERFNEETGAEAFRAFNVRRMNGALTEEDQKSPFMKLVSLAKDLRGTSAEAATNARLAQTAEDALFDQIMLDRYSAVPDMNEKRQEPDKPAKPAEKTPTPAAPTPAAPTPAAPTPAAPTPAAPKTWRASTPRGGVKVGGHYVVVPLSELVHSNHPLYAKHADKQERNRVDNKLEEQVRLNIVNEFDGERLLEASDTANGAPIVFLDEAEDGKPHYFVLSGNGRVMVLNELNARHLYDKYRNPMKAWAAANGVQVPEGDAPVLVRVVTDLGGSSLKEIARLSNKEATTRYTETEQARVDAENIVAAGIAGLYRANANGTADMTPGVNDEFFSRFARIDGGETIFDENNNVTEDGRHRIVRAFLTVACGQGDRGPDTVKKLITMADTLDIGRQRNAAQFMAPAVAQLERNPSYAIGPDVSRAMADFMSYTEQKRAGKIGTLDDFMAQDDMFDPRSAIAGELLKLFASRQAARDVADYVSTYCDVASKSDADGSLGGAGNARTREDVWREAAKLTEERHAKAKEDAEKVRHSFASARHDELMKTSPEYRSVFGRYHNADGSAKPGWLKAPNGKDTNLDPYQWVQVRTPSFLKWFGDWVAALRLDRKTVLDTWEYCQNGNPVTHVTDDVFRRDDGRDLVDLVTEYYSEQFGGAVENPQRGKVLLNRKGVKSSLAGMHGGLYRAKVLGFAAVPEVIRKGMVFDEANDWKGRDERTFVIAAPVMLAGRNYYCEVVVAEKYDRKRDGTKKARGNVFYLQNVYLSETEKALQASKNPTGGLTRSAVAQPTSSILAHAVDVVNGGSSKIVDENGEPLVVYHGTPSEFDEFKYGDHGFWFTPNERSAKKYAAKDGGTGFVVPVFLDVKRPTEQRHPYLEGRTDEKDDWREWLEGDDYDGWICRDGERIFTVVVKDPAKVKSATDNTGTFDGADPRMRFSFAIGEKGASNLADALFVMADLAKAREMLAGRDWDKLARDEKVKIKLATSWEKGADGKWRHEVPDMPLPDMKLLTVENPLYTPMDRETASAHPERADHYKPVMLGNLFSKKDVAALELFRAYPWLRTQVVVYGADVWLGPRARGAVVWDGSILLSEEKLTTPESIRSTLTHEIQHAIQKVEDFARGGSAELGFNMLINQYKAASEDAEKWYDRIEEMVSAADANDIAKTCWNDYRIWRYNRSGYITFPAKSPEVKAAAERLAKLPGWKEIDKARKAFKEKYGHEPKYFANGNWMDARRYAAKSALDVYRSLAGEVESRSMQRRIGMNDVQRLQNMLIEDSEDVARKDQILLDGAMKEIEKAISADAAAGILSRRLSVRVTVDGSAFEVDGRESYPQAAKDAMIREMRRAFPEEAEWILGNVASVELDKRIVQAMNKAEGEAEFKPLVAIHGMSQNAIRSVLRSGSFIMPSVAISPKHKGMVQPGYTDVENAEGGSVFVSFGKESLTGNNDSVYRGDAWTPTIRNLLEAGVVDVDGEIPSEGALDAKIADLHAEFERGMGGKGVEFADVESEALRRLLYDSTMYDEDDDLEFDFGIKIRYAEAKLWRRVPVAEAKAAVLVGCDPALADELREHGVTVVELPAGTPQNAIAEAQSKVSARFSFMSALPSGREVPTADLWQYMDGEGKTHDTRWSKFLSRAISSTLDDIIDRLQRGIMVPKNEVLASPEWSEAKARADAVEDELEKTYGVRETVDIKTPEREDIRERIKLTALSPIVHGKVEIPGIVGPNGKPILLEMNEALGKDESYEVARERQACIVIGLPSAGKSSVFANKLSLRYRARVCDSDAIKKVLPEFDNGYGGNAVHNESSNINEQVRDQAIARGENIVYPILGYKPKNLLNVLAFLRDHGYNVKLFFNELSAAKAESRLIMRFMLNGRYLPLECIEKAGDTTIDCYKEIKHEFDEYAHCSNDVPFKSDPVIVESSRAAVELARELGFKELERYASPALYKYNSAGNERSVAQTDELHTDRRSGQETGTVGRSMSEGWGVQSGAASENRRNSLDLTSDSEAAARRSIRAAIADGGQKEAENALANYVAYFELSHGGVPQKRTLARMGLAMGMKTVAPDDLLRKGASIAEQMRGTLIERAAKNGDVATTLALLKREKDMDAALDDLVAGAAGAGGSLTHKGVGKVNDIINRRVEQLMRDFSAASLADMEGETGLDIAAEILANDPSAFDKELKKKGLDPNDAAQTADDQEKGDGEDGEGGDGEEEGAELTDRQKWEREQRRREAEAKVAKFIAEAKKRAEERKAAAERLRQKRAADEAASGNADGETSGASGDAETARPLADDVVNSGGTVRADFKDPREFAAFLRVWAADKFARTHGLTSLGKAEENRLFAEFYRICARRELNDLAQKLLAPKGARAWVNRRLQDLEKGVKPDVIEGISADVFAFINKAAIRENRAALVQKFKHDLKERYFKGTKFDEFKQDTDRKVTGWVEEAARYICRVCDLSKREINGEPSQLQKERAELRDIIDRRAEVYDESGKDIAQAAVEDAETRKALWKLALLDKFGAMTALMPGEILDLQDAAFRHLETQAADLEAKWKETRELQERIRGDLTQAVVAPNGQRYQEKGWLNGRLFDALNGLIRLRLKHLTRFASEDVRKKADDSINEILVMLGDGETLYARALQDDRAAFFAGLAQIFQKPGGGADNKAIKAYLERMDTPIPEDLSRRISNQGFGGTMTYGQMLQLLVSLEQRSFRDAVEENGREGQADLIRNYVGVDENGNPVRAFTANDEKFIAWLRAFYEAKRETISKVTERMVGQRVDSPDPLYCPVRRLMEDRARGLHSDPTPRWDPIAKVFSRRVENLRDFDETRSIVSLFFEASEESAKLVAWAERGSVIRNVFTSVGVQSAIRRAFGPGELGKILKQLEATFNGGESRNRTPGELAAMDKAMNFATYAYLGFNPLSAMKQTTSFTVWANVLPGGFKDLWKYMTHFDGEVVKHLKESDEYRVRYGNDVGSGQDMATKGLYENPSANPIARIFSGAGMWLLKKGDFVPGIWIAQGVYKDMLNRNLSKGMAFDAADRRAITETFNLLEETQQSGRTYNTNMLSIEHGRIGRLLTQFATSPLQQLQFETQAWREWRDMMRYGMGEKRIAEARQRLLRAVIINHVLIPAALELVISAYRLAMGEEPPWEKEGAHWDFLTEILMGQFGRVFFMGAFAQTTLNAVFKRQAPRGGEILPTEGLLGMAAKVGFMVHDFATCDVDRLQKDLEQAARGSAATRTAYNVFRRVTGDSDEDRKAEKERKKKK